MPPPSHPVDKRHDAPDSRHHAVKKRPAPGPRGRRRSALGETDAGCGCAPLRLERALYAAKALCKMSAAVEKRMSLFWRIADGQSQTCERNGLRKVQDHPTVAVQRDRSYAGKRREKTEEGVKTRLAVFVLCASSLLAGQAMKIERSGYEPEIKTNLLVATVVTNPNIHYLLTCSPDRNDCELLLAGERYEFTPAPERVYPTGPNLATHGDGKRIVVLV